MNFDMGEKENIEGWSASDEGNLENITRHLEHIEKECCISLFEEKMWLKKIKNRLMSH